MLGNISYNSESEIDSDIENLLYSQLHYSTEIAVDENSELVLEDSVKEVDDLDSGDSKAEYHKQTQQKKKDVWKISEKDQKGAEAYNKSLSNVKRYYIEEQERGVMCYNCRNRGHLSRDCPQPQKKENCYLCGEGGHIRRDCPNDVCYNCYEVGHISKFCNEPKKNYYSLCKRCWGRGHNKRTCPEIWRQYHLTVADNEKIIRPKKGRDGSLPNIKKTRYCYNCGLEGHFGHDCEKHRQSRRAVNSPFIVYYDKCPYKPSNKQAKENADARQTGKSSRDKQSSLQNEEFPSRAKNKDKTTKESERTDDYLDHDDHKIETSKGKDRLIRSSSRLVRVVRDSIKKSDIRDASNEKSDDRKDKSVSGKNNFSNNDRKSPNRNNDGPRTNDKITGRIIINSDCHDSEHSGSPRKDMNNRVNKRSKSIVKDGFSAEPKSQKKYSQQAKQNDSLRNMDEEPSSRFDHIVFSSDNGEDVVLGSKAGQNGKCLFSNIVLSSDTTDVDEQKSGNDRDVMPKRSIEKKTGENSMDRAAQRKRKWRTSEDNLENTEEKTKKKIKRNNLKLFREDDEGRKDRINEDIFVDEGRKESEEGDEYCDDFINLDVYGSFSDDEKEKNDIANNTKKEDTVRRSIGTNYYQESDERRRKTKVEDDITSSKTNKLPKKTKNKFDTENLYIHPERRGIVGQSQFSAKKEMVSAFAVGKESGEVKKKRKSFKIVDRRIEYVDKQPNKHVPTDNHNPRANWIEDKVHMHKERQQLLTSTPSLNSDRDVRNSPRPKKRKALKKKKSDSSNLGDDSLDSKFSTPKRKLNEYLNDSDDEQQDRGPQFVRKDNNRKKKDKQDFKISSKQTKRNVNISKLSNERSSQIYYDEASFLDSLPSASAVSSRELELRLGNHEKVNKTKDFVDESTTDEENFQFSNLLINQDNEDSSEEDDLRYKINTLKEKKRQKRNSDYHRDHKMNSKWLTVKDGKEDLSNEREAHANEEEFYGKMQEDSNQGDLLVDDQRKVDFTQYDPTEASDDHLAYYGLSRSTIQCRREDEKFKQPEHIVFVENEDDDEDDDGNDVDVTEDVIAKKPAIKNKLKTIPKIKRLENASVLKDVISSNPFLPTKVRNRYQENYYIETRNENDGKEFQETVLILLSKEKVVDIKKLPFELMSDAYQFAKKFRRKKSKFTRYGVQKEWKKWVKKHDAMKYFPDLKAKFDRGELNVNDYIQNEDGANAASNLKHGGKPKTKGKSKNFRRNKAASKNVQKKPNGRKQITEATPVTEAFPRYLSLRTKSNERMPQHNYYSANRMLRNTSAKREVETKKSPKKSGFMDRGFKPSYAARRFFDNGY